MATPVFCCGFECGANAAHWGSMAAFASFSTTTVRSGTRSFRSNPSSQSSFAAQLTLNGTSLPFSATVLVARFYVRFATLPDQNTWLLLCRDSANANLGGVYFKSSDGKLWGGADNDTTSGFTVTTGVWYRVDFKLNANTGGSPFRTLDASVDGTSLGQATGASASVVEKIYIDYATSGRSGDTFYDDVLMSHTAADYPIGAGYVNHFIPTSDGTHNIAGANDFERSATGTDITNATTTAYQLIDDVPLKSGSVTEYINMIAPASANDYVEVVMGPAPGISTPTTGPRAVEKVIAVAKGTGTGTNNIQTLLYNNDVLVGSAVGGNVTATSPGAMYFTRQYPTGASGSAWSASGGNGNFNLVRLRGSSSDAAPDPWWASAMIEAEFEEVAPPAGGDILDPFGMAGFFGQ